MASRTWKDVQAAQSHVKILHGTYLIPSASAGNGSPVLQTGSIGQSVGFRSGSAAAVAGVYSASFGDASDPADASGGPTRNDLYPRILAINVSIRPETSASSYSPPIERIDILNTNLVSGSGLFTFCTKVLSGNALSGAETETVARPARNLIVDFTVFTKNSNIR